MGNALPKLMTSGTIGELLIQLRLLESGIQAAPPLKDSGNDLVALRGRTIKLIQVKTCDRSKRLSTKKLPKIYDVLAIVNLQRDPVSDMALLDESMIYLWEKDEIEDGDWPRKRFDSDHIFKNKVDTLWPSDITSHYKNYSQ